jgi:beta-N-acetylhexosaminidase
MNKLTTILLILSSLLLAACIVVIILLNLENTKIEETKTELSHELSVQVSQRLISILKEEIPKRINDEYKLLEFYKSLTLEQRVGQLFMVGHTGEAFDDRAKKLITERYIGGFCFYKKNAGSREQVFGLTSLMQKESLEGVISDEVKHGIPLFIAGDNEPGRRWMSMSHLVQPLPVSGDVPEKFTIEEAGKNFSELAVGLKGLGYNIDFAPVADVNTNADNPIIGERAFSDDADTVASYVTEFVSQFNKAGIIPTAKHFPGHGDTQDDSHKELPRISHDRSRLDNIELKPFREAIETGVSLIMTAHVVYEVLDEENPATFSKAILTDLLRGEMGFDGVVITDDMYMGAILENYDQKDALVTAINAGADIVLCTQIYNNLNSQEELYDAVLQAVKDGEISEERLREAVLRILRLKATTPSIRKMWHSSPLSTICND